MQQFPVVLAMLAMDGDVQNIMHVVVISEILLVFDFEHPFTSGRSFILVREKVYTSKENK